MHNLICETAHDANLHSAEFPCTMDTHLIFTFHNSLLMQDLTAANKMRWGQDLSRLYNLRAERSGNFFLASAVLGVAGSKFGVPTDLITARKKYRYKSDTIQLCVQ